LSDKLITGEVLIEAVVGSEVFYVGIVSVASEEVEVLTVRFLLNDERVGSGINLHLLFSDVRLSTITLSDLFDDSNKEPTSVLVVRHKSQTLG
jgi:hypothetical protein